MSEESSQVSRRLFLAGAGVAAVGVTPSIAAAGPAQSTAAKWEPSRHTQDDWLDRIPGKHRIVFDTTTPEGMSSALLFANNYYLANASGYGLQDADLAVVIVARHLSTPFAFNESIWSKYGVPISNHVDRAKEPSKVNAYARQVEGLIRRGAHFAVCQMATRNVAGSISRATGGSTDEIFNEIAANLVGNSHLAPAGIVAVGRAQERGYSFVLGV
jgi:intracellular sulfur oxidation DsrE/DsrF family protein